MFEHDDTDFIIQGSEIKELPLKHMRSYSIKHYLFSGKLQVVEGDVLFNMKSALVYISPEGLYAKEYGKYFVKDLEFDSIAWLDDDQVPKAIFDKLNSIEQREVSIELEEPKAVEELELDLEGTPDIEVIPDPEVEEFDEMDVNKDGKVDLKDAVEVVKKVVKGSSRKKKN